MPPASDTKKNKRSAGSSSQTKKNKYYDKYPVKIGYLAPPIEFPKEENNTRVAIIIPHRNRIEHLKRFFTDIANLDSHGFSLDIYVIDQDANGRFNRGLMLNVGFGISHAIRKYQRYIFHDVDSYPDQTLFDYYFAYLDKTIHFASPTLGYKYQYDQFLGGVIGMTERNYVRVNGFPNDFLGWGGEDGAFRTRCSLANLKIFRPSTGKYDLPDHPKPGEGEWNDNRNEQRNNDVAHWRENGIAQIPDMPIQYSYFVYDTFFATYSETKKPGVHGEDTLVFPVKSEISPSINAYFCKVQK